MDFRDDGRTAICCRSAIIVLIWFFTSVAASGVVCPSKTYLAGNTCYIYNTDKSHTWSSANAICKSSGHKLLKIHSWDQFSKLRDWIKRTGYAFWIGANDIGTGSFHWLDGSSNFNHYWVPGEPNHRDDEHCVDFWKTDHGTGLNNEGCGSKMGYLCEVTGPQTDMTVGSLSYVLLSLGISAYVNGRAAK